MANSQAKMSEHLQESNQDEDFFIIILNYWTYYESLNLNL